MINIEIKDFKYNSHLKQLLDNFMCRHYEDCAIYDDEHRLMEYERLKRNNELHLLFEGEWFDGYMNDENNFR